MLKGEAEEVVIEQRRAPVLNLKGAQDHCCQAHTIAGRTMPRNAMGGTAMPVDPLLISNIP